MDPAAIINNTFGDAEGLFRSALTETAKEHAPGWVVDAAINGIFGGEPAVGAMLQEILDKLDALSSQLAADTQKIVNEVQRRSYEDRATTLQAAVSNVKALHQRLILLQQSVCATGLDDIAKASLKQEAESLKSEIKSNVLPTITFINDVLLGTNQSTGLIQLWNEVAKTKLIGATYNVSIASQLNYYVAVQLMATILVTQAYNADHLPAESESYWKIYDGNKTAQLQALAPSLVPQGLVLDTVKGLMWTAAASGELWWPSVQGYVDSANRTNTLGHTDWRLPSIDEIKGLVEGFDKTRDGASWGEHWYSVWLNSFGFQLPPSCSLWSNTWNDYGFMTLFDLATWPNDGYAIGGTDVGQGHPPRVLLVRKP